MKRKVIIFILLVAHFLSRAQVSFNTMVPQQPVVAGESFQVQYIFRDAEKIGNFKAPVFAHFRFVSGPNQYSGSVATANGIKPQRNFVYTLEAVKPGRFIIPGAVATVNGSVVKSNDVVLEVISKEKSRKLQDRNSGDINSEYVLRPGEDPNEKIRQNLFLKLVVDRTHCFAGEPVLAIFKLYSRLESNSDIVKNPGFYGFTVHDMVNLADKQISTERVNGKIFDVHTIREVQLYPLQAGTFTIDAMEIKNRIEFSRSSINKKTEQQIVEGMQGHTNEEAIHANTEIFETSMHTEPVTIRVMPVPDKNKPGAFNGAVGIFTISASALKSQMAKNEEGVFEIRISGSGNFTQLSALSIDWPDGIEGFEPVVRDSLDKTKLPLEGSRAFRYPFICNQPGLYHLPALSFSFFDPRNHMYKTISTTAIPVEISKQEKKTTLLEMNHKAGRKESIAGKNALASRVAAGIVILLVIFVLTYWILQKDKKPTVVKNAPPTIDEMLAPVMNPIHDSDREFCVLLQQLIWKWLGNRLSLAGSSMNKEILFSRLLQEGVKEEVVGKLKKILSSCDIGIFTGASSDLNKDNMLKETKEVLEGINSRLNEASGQTLEG